jgi:hypothetical protein
MGKRTTIMEPKKQKKFIELDYDSNLWGRTKSNAALKGIDLRVAIIEALEEWNDKAEYHHGRIKTT